MTKGKNHFGRVMNCIREFRWPWRLRWMRYVWPGFFHGPLRFIRAFGLFRRRVISEDSFRLKIYGGSIIRDCLDACRKTALSPFLAFGSLLGYYREGGFIDTDSDIDLGVLDTDAGKLPALEEEMLKKGFHIRVKSPSMISFKHKKYRGLYIDMYVWAHSKSGDTEMAYAAIPREKNPDEVSIHPYHASLLSSFRKVRFNGVEVMVPERVEEFLIATYGKGWKVPVPDDLPFEEKVKVIFPNRRIISRRDYERGAFQLSSLREVAD